MKWRWIISLLLLCLVGGAALYGWWRWRYARLEHSQDSPILAAAARYQLDPALVKAVVWRESRFNPQARGRAGEIGLMQLTEIAAQEWADAEALGESYTHEHCLDPATNTLAGSFYLARVLKRYRKTDNPLPYGLADYNAGRGNVLRWLEGESATNSQAFIENIGFPGTKEYVKSILERYDHYKAQNSWKK